MSSQTRQSFAVRLERQLNGVVSSIVIKVKAANQTTAVNGALATLKGWSCTHAAPDGQFDELLQLSGGITKSE